MADMSRAALLMKRTPRIVRHRCGVVDILPESPTPQLFPLKFAGPHASILQPGPLRGARPFFVQTRIVAGAARHGGRVPLLEKAACDAHHRNVSGAAREFRALRQSMLRRNNASDGALQTGPAKIACEYNGFGIG